jgi:hypothetical protein
LPETIADKSAEAIQERIMGFLEVQGTDDFTDDSWILPLDAMRKTLSIMDKLERTKFVDFIRLSLGNVDNKKRETSLVFVNTIATWIKLSNGRDIFDTEDAEHTRFDVGSESVYVDCKSAEVSY